MPSLPKNDQLNDQMTEVAQFFAGSLRGSTDVLLASRLDRKRLNFSLESLHAVDEWLGDLRAAGIDPNNPQAGESIIWAGAYVGEVIRRCTTTGYWWLRYEEFMATQRQDLRELMPLTFGTQFVLMSEKGNVTLPINKVGRWLDEGPENDLHFYASAECAKK